MDKNNLVENVLSEKDKRFYFIKFYITIREFIFSLPVYPIPRQIPTCRAVYVHFSSRGCGDAAYSLAEGGTGPVP